MDWGLALGDRHPAGKPRPGGRGGNGRPTMSPQQAGRATLPKLGDLVVRLPPSARECLLRRSYPFRAALTGAVVLAVDPGGRLGRGSRRPSALPAGAEIFREILEALSSLALERPTPGETTPAPRPARGSEAPPRALTVPTSRCSASRGARAPAGLLRTGRTRSPSLAGGGAGTKAQVLLRAGARASGPKSGEAKARPSPQPRAALQAYPRARAGPDGRGGSAALSPAEARPGRTA